MRTTRISVNIMKKFFVAIFIIFATSVSVININARNSASLCSTTEMEISAPNDGSYTRTQYSVSVYTDSGHFKGKYSIYLHKGKKYIDFCNTWICIQGKSRFGYSGNWYVIK